MRSEIHHFSLPSATFFPYVHTRTLQEQVSSSGSKMVFTGRAWTRRDQDQAEPAGEKHHVQPTLSSESLSPRLSSSLHSSFTCWSCDVWCWISLRRWRFKHAGFMWRETTHYSNEAEAQAATSCIILQRTSEQTHKIACITPGVRSNRSLANQKQIPKNHSLRSMAPGTYPLISVWQFKETLAVYLGPLTLVNLVEKVANSPKRRLPPLVQWSCSREPRILPPCNQQGCKC